jgi:hypothetical protein
MMAKVTASAAKAAMVTLFTYMAMVEPTREGTWHRQVREKTVLVETVNPAIRMMYPLDCEEFMGQFAFQIDNMNFDRGEYTKGRQYRNWGYVTGWVVDSDGLPVRYYDNVTFMDIDGVCTIDDTFPDGYYKVYFQLRRSDGTPHVMANASDMGGFCSAVFSVGQVFFDDTPDTPPNNEPPADEPPVDEPPIGTF